MLGDLGRVPPVVVHRKLLKTELPEHRVTPDFRLSAICVGCLSERHGASPMALTLLTRSVSEDKSQSRFPYLPRSRCGLLDLK